MTVPPHLPLLQHSADLCVANHRNGPTQAAGVVSVEDPEIRVIPDDLIPIIVIVRPVMLKAGTLRGRLMPVHPGRRHGQT